MGRFKFKKTLLGLASVLMASSLFAQDALVDDHTDGTNANEFEVYWYYYDDNSGVKDDDRPAAAPSSTPSVIQVDYVEKPREAFGDPNDTWKVKDYTFTVDEEAGNKFATMPFVYGDEWEASYGTATPYVGIGTMLAVDGKYIDLTKPTEATGVKFKIKSRVTELAVVFKIETYDITMDSTYTYYQKAITTSTAWDEVTVLIADLEQPGWTPAADEKPFDQTKVTKLAWEVPAGSNAITGDTLDVDDVYILNYLFRSPTVKWEFSPMGQTNGMFHHFENAAYKDATVLKTYWYAYNDHQIGGTSQVLDGATLNAETGLLTLNFAAGSGSDGVGNAPYLQLQCGPIIKQANAATGETVDVQGFVGIGFNVYDSTTSTYFDASTGKRGTTPADATGGATGVYFEYLADGDFKYVTLEVSDINDVGDATNPTRKDSRGSGIVWYRNLPKTDGEWKAMYVGWDELITHDDWKGYVDIPLDTKQLAKVQFKVQGAEGQAGVLFIDNVCFPGAQFPVGVTADRNTWRALNSGFTTTYQNGRIMVSLNNGEAISNGTVRLINSKGVVVKSAAVNGLSSTVLPAWNVPSGKYFVNLNAVNANGNAVNQRSALTIVR